MYVLVKSTLDRILSNSIYLTTDYECSDLRDKLSGVVRGKRAFLIPYSIKLGEERTSPGEIYLCSKWHYIELRESMECTFEDFDGNMLKVRTDNGNLMLFAISELEDVLIGKTVR